MESRRAILLGSLGLLSSCIAGCLSESPSEGTYQSIGGMGIEESSTTHPEIELDVGFTQEGTRNEPPKIAISLTNTGSVKTIGFGSHVPLSDFLGESADGGDKLFLVPEESSGLSARDLNGDGEFELIPEEKPDDCWKTGDKPIRADVLRERRVSMNESVTGEYSVLVFEGNVSCNGRYRFSEHLQTRDDENFEMSFELVNTAES